MNQYREIITFIILALTISLSQVGKSETFVEALSSIYNNNPQLQAQRIKVKEIDENYIQAISEGGVQAGVSGSLETNTAKLNSNVFSQTDGSTSVSGNPRAIQLQITKPLYQGGRVKWLKSQTRSSVLSARENLKSFEQNIFMAGAEAYVSVLRNEEAARIRRNSVKVLTRQRLAAIERFNIGVGTRTDIAQAESRLASSESGLAQAESQLQSSRAAFVRIVGHVAVNLQEVPSFEIPKTADEVKSLARSNNPDLLAAYFSGDAAASAISVAKSAYRPKITLNALAGSSRGQTFGIGDSDQLALSARVSVPIFTSGMNRSRVRKASLAKARLDFELRDLELSIDQIVEQSWHELNAARLAFSASKTQVSAAEVAFEGVSLEQELGLRNALDLLNAEQEVLNAKLSVADARYNVSINEFKILMAMGAFHSKGIKLPVSFYNPEGYFEDISDNKISNLLKKFE